MITSIIFFAHYLFSLIIFTKKWQDENLKSAFYNIVFIGILFTVGWTITSSFSKILMEQKGFGIFFDRDTFALTILSFAEYFFYKFYYKNILTTEAEMEKQ